MYFLRGVVAIKRGIILAAVFSILNSIIFSQIMFFWPGVAGLLEKALFPKGPSVLVTAQHRTLESPDPGLLFIQEVLDA